MAKSIPAPVNERFGLLVVLAEAPPTSGKQPRRQVLVRCDCGKQKTVHLFNVIRGRSLSCGCNKKSRLTHGQSGTKGTWSSWQAMLQRCRDERSINYQKYGGRGISVCDRWLSFECFFADMGDRPQGNSIERINNEGNYEPNNCRWATSNEQARNKRNTRWLTLDGKTASLAEWAEAIGVNASTIRTRLGNNWTVQRALTTPSKKYDALRAEMEMAA